jgi:voltage-gated potassium channel Kch
MTLTAFLAASQQIADARKRIMLALKADSARLANASLRPFIDWLRQNPEGTLEQFSAIFQRDFHLTAKQKEDLVTHLRLGQAHIARASMLVVTTPAGVNVQPIVAAAQALNPHIETVVRGHSADEAERIAQATGSAVFMADEALAQSMSRHVLERTGMRLAAGSVPASVHHRG